MLLVFVMVLGLLASSLKAATSTISGDENVALLREQRTERKGIICKESQSKALIEFYHHGGFNKQDMDYYWPLHDLKGTQEDCCLWSGVTCNALGFVVSLQLGSVAPQIDWLNATQASPSWPLPLGKLQSLQELHLELIDFKSPLPPAMGLLPQSLLRLSISNCILPSPMPWTALGNLSSLRYLEVSNNGVMTKISEVCNLTNLQHLDLSYNGPTYMPACLSLMPHLSYLDLSGNLFSVLIPRYWNSSSSLTHLDLSFNHLRGPIHPGLLGHNLQFLHLERNNLSGSIPESLGNLTKLFELNIADNQLSGTISQIHWENLLNLTALDLSTNQLSGTIPASLGQLAGANPVPISISLSANSLAGELPLSLLTNTHIGTLDLSSNYLTSVVGLSSIESLRVKNRTSRLQHLDLSHNNMTGFLPTWITSLRSLQYLDLSFNKFTNFANRSFIPSFGDALETLDLSHNILNGPILPWLNATHLSGASTLDVSDNLFHGTIPSWFVPFGAVDLSSNLLSGSLSLAGLCTTAGYHDFNLAASYNNFSRLIIPAAHNTPCTFSGTGLNLHSNNLKGVIPWQALFLADSLDLADNSLSGQFPEWLAKTHEAPSISNLDLSHNLLSGAIPPYLNTWGSLEFIDLSSNFFSGQIPSSICLASSPLIRLRFADNNIKGSIPDELAHCTSLQSLVLRHNFLTGFIPAGISKLSSTLQMLDLAHNHLEGSLPLWLQQMYSLRVLSLGYNNLRGPLPATSVWNTTQLQVFDLSNNNLSGSISAQSLSVLQGFLYNSTRDVFSDTLYEESIIQAKGEVLDFTYVLKATVSLDLSHNKLHGPIPSQLGTLDGLIFLNLSHNHLNGTIPLSLNSLTQLNSLDISNNDLEGGIPDLCSLTSLGFINVSDNHLKGLIPQCNQWLSYPSSYFLGNKGLCGQQIGVPCPSSSVNNNATLGPVQGLEEDEDADFVHGIIVGLCISFPLCLVLAMFWWPISHRILIMSEKVLAKLCGL